VLEAVAGPPAQRPATTPAPRRSAFRNLAEAVQEIAVLAGDEPDDDLTSDFDEKR